MKNLKDILYKVALNSVIGSSDVAISKIEFDSREVEKNDVFVALKGTLVDGHDYIEKAIKLQAKVIICEVFPEEKSNEVTYVQVSDANTALAIMASNYFENPSANLQLVGVTGTNGKSTIA